MAQPRPDRASIRDDDLLEPRPVRRLRMMVSLLMAVLIIGMVVVAAVMVIRLGSLEQAAPAPARISAERFTLPDGAEIVAGGQGGSGVIIVTRDQGAAETLRVFDPATGAETSATPIARE